MEELDQLGLRRLSRSFWQATLLVFEILEHLLPQKCSYVP